MIMKVINNLKPIYDKNSEVLILGSMPSIISRENNFYYFNKTNRFWCILERLFNVKLNDIDEKINFLLKNHIALWDTIYSCEIKGSSDSSISNVKVNNIKKLLNESNITTIFATGKKSLEIYNKYLKDNIKIEAIYLPSPSSANATFSLDRLILEYKILKKYLKQ